MISRTRLRTLTVLILIVLVILLGIVGYQILEGWSLIDALYMTVITMTTVGFEEVGTLGAGGRCFTIFLIFCGVGLWAYALGIFSQILLEGQLRDFFDKRRSEKMIKSLQDHIIVCGFGRMGTLVSREIAREKKPFVVIEKDASVLDDLRELDYHYIGGDATEEDVLKDAGVEKAKTLIAVLPSDAGNVYVALTGRALNPALHIICRTDNPGCEDKMIRAGANKVISPYEIGGRSLAQAALRPNVLSFFEMATTRHSEALVIEELIVPDNSPLIGKTLLESRIREKHGVSIVGHKNDTGDIRLNPPPSYTIEEGTLLIALGSPQGLKALSDELLDNGGSVKRD